MSSPHTMNTPSPESQQDRFSLSFVARLLDEENTLEGLCGQIAEYAREHRCCWEVIFIDDATTESGCETIRTLRKRYPKNVKVDRVRAESRTSLCDCKEDTGDVVQLIGYAHKERKPFLVKFSQGE